MKKKIFFLFFFLNIFNTSIASIKSEIINNFKKIDNLSFDFKQVIEEKSENLIRDGINIHHELYINISEAILGCKKEIPTINGKVQISIPSGVDNGKILRLKSKGIPLPLRLGPVTP